MDDFLLYPHTRLLVNAHITILEKCFHLLLLHIRGQFCYELDRDDPILLILASLEFQG